jgi:hypothetical protein
MFSLVFRFVVNSRRSLEAGKGSRGEFILPEAGLDAEGS